MGVSLSVSDWTWRGKDRGERGAGDEYTESKMKKGFQKKGHKDSKRCEKKIKKAIEVKGEKMMMEGCEEDKKEVWCLYKE